MNASQKVFANYFFEEIGAAIGLLMRVSQRTADAFIRARDADGPDGNKVVAKGINGSPAGIEPLKHLFPVTLGEPVLYAFVGYQLHSIVSPVNLRTVRSSHLVP
jgi:hypothetical protein